MVDCSITCFNSEMLHVSISTNVSTILACDNITYYATASKNISYHKTLHTGGRLKINIAYIVAR